MTDPNAIWLLIGLLLGMAVTLLSGVIGARLVWRLTGNEGHLLRREREADIPDTAGLDVEDEEA